ncbi:tetratricopeptide repeat protein [Culturomica massiliensis]|uniref:tetratricopeptide repeat protein n=1 Tax=Culturomica massiliensis TaxID=1841857 RepID=UPI00266FC69E|nr:tetratricopeptide repeat protein [Culturomica massiliensis]
MKRWFTIGGLLLCILTGNLEMQASRGVAMDTLSDEENMQRARAFIEAGNWDRAYSCFARPARHGNAEALYYEGYLYETGRVYSPSVERAIACYREAAAKGQEEAQFQLANLYYNYGIDSCYTEALHYYRLGAERGDARLQWALGRMFEQGVGVQQDDVRAFRWYLKAAEQGLDRACYSVGRMYAAGRGTACNDAEAAAWFLRAAEKNEAMAQYRVGLAYLKGTGIARDTLEACYWLRKAAQNPYDYIPHEAAEKELRALGMWKEEWYQSSPEPDTVIWKNGSRIEVYYHRE